MIHAGVMQAHKKCAMKIKERKKENRRLPCNKFLMTGMAVLEI